MMDRVEQRLPATLQLAAGKVVLMCRIVHGQSRVLKRLPKSLTDVLEDSTLLKVGVGVKGDAARLETFLGTTVNKAQELNSVARTYNVDDGHKRGLVDQCAHYLGRILRIGMTIPTWSRETFRRTK